MFQIIVWMFLPKPHVLGLGPQSLVPMVNGLRVETGLITANGGDESSGRS